MVALTFSGKEAKYLRETVVFYEWDSSLSGSKLVTHQQVLAKLNDIISRMKEEPA